MTNADSEHKHVQQRYRDVIDYYWRSSRHNRWAYKTTRTLIIILGALVTLVTALSSASFVSENPRWDMAFMIGAPVLAAILTIVGGFSQQFQWGAAWRDMVLSAERLERERDRFSVMLPEGRDPVKELDTLNDLVIEETEGFFQRILGGGKGKNNPQDSQNEEA